MSNIPQYQNIYQQQYFSGGQAALYIGDIFVDEITSFAFTDQQVKTPIYGYSSQLFDATTAGPFIVQGNFCINYKHANYLYLVLMRYQSLIQSVNQAIANAGGNNSQVLQNLTGIISGSASTLQPPANLPAAFQTNQQTALQQGVSSIITGSATGDQKNNFISNLSAYANSPAMIQNFNNIAATFEQQIWQDKGNNPDTEVRRPDDNYFDGFDIFCSYGNIGDPTAPSTTERILGVRLTGRSKAVSISGEPIQEEYQFIARNHM